MTNFQKNHWHLPKPTFIFQHGGAETPAESEKAPEKAEEKPKTPPERIDKFKNDYNSEAWEKELEKNLLKDVPDNIKNKLKADAMARYKTKYNEVLTRLHNAEEDHDKLLGEIKEKQEGERELVGNAVKNLQKLEKSKSALRQIESKSEIDDRFEEFLDALHAQYFNFEWQKEQGHMSEEAFDEYRALAGDKWYKSGFKDNIEDYLENQLDYILEHKQAKDPKWLKQKLSGLENRLTERYKLYANKDGFIDLAELKSLERGSKKYVDVIQLINSGKGIEEIAKQAEYQEFFNNKNWRKATDVITEQFITDAKKNGTEASFIKAVQEMSGDSEKMSFSDAISKFKKLMSKRADAGVRETITAVEKFNKAVNGERAEILALDHIQPASIHNMVRQERKLLLGRLTEPISKDDHMIMEFVSTDRNGRNMMLSTPNGRRDLFIAIQNIQTHYPTIYKKDYKDSLPKKRSQLTNSKNPDKPHKHNRIARLLAMITLAKEAEWVIKNFDKSEEYKDQNLLADLGKVKIDAKAPAINMKFRDVNKLHSTSYVSALSRGGFNGRDLLLGAGKVLAVLTVFANLMQARKQKKLFSLDHIQNPALIAAGAGWFALDKFQENKQYANYFSEDVGGRMRMHDHSVLNKLAKKAGHKKLKSFINNADEWNAMEDIGNSKISSEKIEKLLKKARETDPKNPKLRKEDLKGLITVKRNYDLLPEKGNDHIRYLFYKTFLTKERNIRVDLRENCKAWV